MRGLSAKNWDGCLSTFHYHWQSPTVVACSNRYFAVGFSSGKVMIYHDQTCQEVKALELESPVKYLLFNQAETTVVVCCVRSLFVWDIISWQQLYNFDLPALCMSVALEDEDKYLLGALKDNSMCTWDLDTGTFDKLDWTDDFDDLPSHALRSPTTAAFSTEQGLLAIVYRGQDIVIWIFENAKCETYSKESGAQPLEEIRRGGMVSTFALIFNSGPGTSSLVAAYTDGDLVLFDTLDGTRRASTTANVQVLAGSLDGRTLAGGDSTGTIHLFDFETLSSLYRISSGDYGIKSMAFSADGYRLLDTRGSHCRVWDPLVLYRHSPEEENSDTVSVSITSQEVTVSSPDDLMKITVLACHPSGDVVFCGKEDGSVLLYETKTGEHSRTLFHHAHGVAIVSLLFDAKVM